MSEDDGPLAVDEHPVLEVCAHGARKNQPLEVPADAHEVADLVAIGACDDPRLVRAAEQQARRLLAEA